MAEDVRENPTHQTSSAFSALLRTAKSGDRILIRSLPSSDAAERSGVIRDLGQDGMVIDTNDGVEWVPAQDIYIWSIPKQLDPTAVPQCFVPKDPSITNQQDPSSSQIKPANDMPLSPQETPPFPGTSSLTSPADLELLFAGDPALSLPSISFSFPTLSLDIRQDIDRWKNRYDYAQKVREPARMSQDVARIAELADTLDNPGLYVLAGLLADFSGLGNARSKTYFHAALQLDTSNQAAAIAIAVLAIRDHDWKAAVEFLLWGVRLEGEMDKTNVVKCIAQCLLRIETRDIPPIGGAAISWAT